MPDLDRSEARRRFADARVGHLATIDRDGGPHIVPVVFAVEGDRIYSVVDAKPKRSVDLQRLANIGADPRVAMLVDAYGEDWSALWWVRADGRAAVVEMGAGRDLAIGLLRAKYAQYRGPEGLPAIGPAIVIEVERWSGWAAGR